MLIKTKSGGFSKFLLSKINLAIKRNQTKLVFKKLKNYSSLLQILTTQGYIKSYEEYPDLLIIHLKTTIDRRYRSLIELNFSSRVARKPTASFYHLNKLQRRQGFVSDYILATDRGLLTSNEALFKKIGGKIIVKLT